MVPGFESLIGHLERNHPGVYRFSAAMRGRAPGLCIETPGVLGAAFVFPADRAGWLFCLEDLGETFSVPTVDEVGVKLLRWSSPAPWTAPPPVDREAERAQLARVLAGTQAREVAVDVDGTVVAELGRALDPERLVRSFPADPAGRLALATRVVLAAPAPAKSAIARSRCIVAEGPKRRKDPQRIQVWRDDVILANQDHRWEDAPWLWTADAPPEDELAPPLGGEEALAAFDAGDLEGGLGRFGVGLSADLRSVLGGVRIHPPACCAHVEPGWTALLVDVVRACAPWRLAAVAGSKPVRIAIFPAQTHARKAGIALGRDDGRPALVIDTTASNVRLPDRSWRRPLAMDLRRYGLTEVTAGQRE